MRVEKGDIFFHQRCTDGTEHLSSFFHISGVY
jgi:hypothetical protein